MKLVYCRCCLMPTTKPDLKFNTEGVCSARTAFQTRPKVDWDGRGTELTKILDRFRNRDGSNWGCVVPVSGGKDSTYQALRMKELGMRPHA